MDVAYWQYDFLRLKYKEYRHWADLRKRQVFGTPSIGAQLELKKLETKAKLEPDEATARLAFWRQARDQNLFNRDEAEFTVPEQQAIFWGMRLQINSWMGLSPGGTLPPNEQAALDGFLAKWKKGWEKEVSEMQAKLGEYAA